MIYPQKDAPNAAVNPTFGLGMGLGAAGGTAITTPLPLTISGLVMWFDATKGTFQDSALTTQAVADGDPVGGWVDQSGNTKNALQTTNADRPTLKLNIANGKSILRFDGLAMFLKTAAVGLSTFTILSVLHDATAAATAAVVYEQSVNANTNAGCFAASGTGAGGISVFRVASLDSKTTTTAGWLNIAGFHQISHDYDGTDAGYLLRMDAAAVGLNAGSVNPGTTTATDNIYLMARAGTSLWTAGDFAEFLVYTPQISSANRGLLEAYLKAKWGTP